MSDSAEKVDVAIVGAGLAGLATAVALHKVRPDAIIKVYERRKAPEGLQCTQEDANADPKDSTSKKDSSSAAPDIDAEFISRLGGGVRLEMNGLKAVAAISRDLAAGVVGSGLYANKVLLHDTLGGAVVSRLQEPPHPSSPSPRQPAMMVGWSELEALLLERLPPDTVEWETVATTYTDSHAGTTLHLLRPSHSQSDEEAIPSHALSTAMTHALDTELHSHMQRQRDQIEEEIEPSGAPGEVPASPFAAGSAGGAFSATGPVAAPASGHTEAAGLLTAPRLERLSVKAKLLVAADGPMSLIRQQCIGDGEPDFEGMVRWVGRLPGDMLSTIPVEQEAWWMGGGMTFASHPLSDGDVAWEAQVSSACLARAGLKWDQQTQSIIRDTPSNTTTQHTNTTTAASGPSYGAEDSAIPAAAAGAAAAAAPAADDDSFEGFAAGNGSNGSDGSSSSGKQGSRVAAPADAPAGEEHATAAAASPVVTLAAAAALAQAVASAPTTLRSTTDTASARGTPRAGTSTTNGPLGGNSSTGVRHVKISPAKPTMMTYDAADSSSMQPLQGVRDAKSLLLQLFADFPTACLDMIDTTDADVILEGPVLTRAARKMPACMGRGSVVVLGEAAHPVRPSGQEASQAFEDAAEFGAAVMHWGINREALRRFELHRRPRWTHAMQVSQAFGSVTNLGGVALHQGLLDYTAQLYHMRFTPLRTMVHPEKTQQKKRRNPILHWTGVALLTYGTLAAAGLTHRHLAREGKSPLGQITGRVPDPVANAVVGAVDAVGQSAERLVSSAAGAVQSPGQTASAIKGAAQKGLSVAVEGSGQAAAVIGKQVGKVGGLAKGVVNGGEGDVSSGDVVHGEVPPRHRKGVLKHIREGVVKRTLGVGVFISKPFTAVLEHQVKRDVAETLGAF